MFASTICAFVGSRGKKTVCNSCARKPAVQVLCKPHVAPVSVQTCARISRQVFPLLSTPYFTNGGSGWLAGRMPANWRADCHATGGCVPPGTAGSSQRDSEAAGGRQAIIGASWLWRGECGIKIFRNGSRCSDERTVICGKSKAFLEINRYAVAP